MGIPDEDLRKFTIKPDEKASLEAVALRIVRAGGKITQVSSDEIQVVFPLSVEINHIEHIRGVGAVSMVKKIQRDT